MQRLPTTRNVLRTTLFWGLIGCADPRDDTELEAALAQEATPQSELPDQDPAGDLPGLTGPRDIDGSGCTIPPDCKDVRTIGFNLNVCCTKQLACGVDLTPLVSGLLGPESGLPEWITRPLLKEVLPKGTDLKRPCVPPPAMWMPTKSLPDQRKPGNPEILLAARCPSLALVGFPLYGCCMPDDKCGLSTHYMLSDIKALSNTPEKIPPAQCTTSATISKIVEDTTVKLFSPVPATMGSCNYASLKAKLPPLPPPEE